MLLPSHDTQWLHGLGITICTWKRLAASQSSAGRPTGRRKLPCVQSGIVGGQWPNNCGKVFRIEFTWSHVTGSWAFPEDEG